MIRRCPILSENCPSTAPKSSNLSPNPAYEVLDFSGLNRYSLEYRQYNATFHASLSTACVPRAPAAGIHVWGQPARSAPHLWRVHRAELCQSNFEAILREYGFLLTPFLSCLPYALEVSIFRPSEEATMDKYRELHDT